MTVPSSVAKSGPYLCNGVTDVFNYDFRIVNKAHLRVVLTDATGVETNLMLTTHYAVSDVGADVGSISLTPAGVALAATGTKLTILRNPPFTQETDLQNQGAYYAETVEDRLDLITMQIQTVKERSDRSVAVPVTESGGSFADLSKVALSGAYADLSGKPTLGTAASTAASDYATAAEGVLAGTALQPADIGVSVGDVLAANNGSDFDDAAKTLDNLGGFAAANVIDEDDMASDSATKVPTQQSVKAYVNARTLLRPEDFGTVVYGAGVSQSEAQANADAVNAALDAAETAGGGQVIVGSDVTIGATVDVPANIKLEVLPGFAIKPSANMAIMVLVHAGGQFVGEVDVKALADFTGIGVKLTGADEAIGTDGSVHRVHTKTIVDLVYRANYDDANDNGTACYVDATAADYEAMGIEAVIRSRGGDVALHIEGGGLSNAYANSNRFRVYSTYTLRALLMESADAGEYGLDGNEIYIEHQPRPDTTVPALVIRGQNNRIAAMVWDWDGVAGTSPFAVDIGASVRNSVFTFPFNPAYIDNNSTSATNLFLGPYSGGFKVDTISAGASGATKIDVLAADLSFANDKGISFKQADNTAHTLIKMTTNDDVTVRAPNVAGKFLIYDALNATGAHYWRVGSGNRMSLTANGVTIYSTASASNYFQLNPSAISGARVATLPDVSGTLGIKVGVPASATAAGVVGSWAADASFLYICTAANTWKRVAIAAW